MDELKQERQPERASTVLRSDSALSFSRVATTAEIHHPPASVGLIPDSSLATDGFSGFRSRESDVSSEEDEIHESAHRDSVLLQSAKNYGPMEDVSEDLDKQVAAMVNYLFENGMREEDYKDILEDEITQKAQ